MKPKDYDDKWTRMALVDRFQRIIRHPEYKAFCDEHLEYFDDQGWQTDLLDKSELTGAFEKMGDRFGLEAIIHYRHAPSYFDKLHALPIFKEVSSVSIFWFREEVDGVLTSSPIHSDGCLHLQIDMNAQETRIVNEVQQLLRQFRRTDEHHRNHLEKNAVCFRVYDLYFDGGRPTDIAKALGLNSVQSACDKIRKAYDLIGIPFEPRTGLTDQELAALGRWDECAKPYTLREKLPNTPVDQIVASIDVAPSQTSAVKSQAGQDIQQFCDKCPEGNQKCRSTIFEALETEDYTKMQVCPSLKDFLKS